MLSDGQWDWVDEAISRDAWEPPPDFARRVVAQATASLPPRRLRPFGFAELVRVAVIGLCESMVARIDGWLWTMTQYRALIFRSG
jgi:hypothetical protein